MPKRDKKMNEKGKRERESNLHIIRKNLTECNNRLTRFEKIAVDL